MPSRRPPADDDLQPAEEELRRQKQESEGMTAQSHKPPSTARADDLHLHGQGAPRESDRGAYFLGSYASARESTEAVENRLIEQSGIPAELRPRVLQLIHVMRQHGLDAALPLLHKDLTMDRKFEEPILRLLATLARDDLRNRR